MLDEVQRWHFVQDAIGESVSIYSFLRWLRTKDLQEKLVQEPDNAVKLMTVHASKGLEFPVVFVIGMNQNVFPSKRTEDIEEERRLFYVAITRAKDRLYITRPEKREAYPGGPMVLQMESQFIRESQIKQVEDINKPQGKAAGFGWLD
jgi:DNA helicase-2/ATP-dependent DNA helicase PcrA